MDVIKLGLYDPWIELNTPYKLSGVLKNIRKQPINEFLKMEFHIFGMTIWQIIFWLTHEHIMDLVISNASAVKTARQIYEKKRDYSNEILDHIEKLRKLVIEKSPEIHPEFRKCFENQLHHLENASTPPNELLEILRVIIAKQAFILNREMRREIMKENLHFEGMESMFFTVPQAKDRCMVDLVNWLSEIPQKTEHLDWFGQRLCRICNKRTSHTIHKFRSEKFPNVIEMYLCEVCGNRAF